MSTTTFEHDPLPFGAMQHPGDNEAAGGSAEPPLSVATPQITASDLAVGILGLAVVAFLVYSFARTK
jgi:hypothetical protein